MTQRFGVVYKHTNKVNGKVYIGKTTQNINRRFRNGRGYKSCVVFNNAINKYGWSNFETTILYRTTHLEELKKIEGEYILKYKSNNPKYGYNIVEIDKGLDVYPEESRLKMAKARYKYLATLTEPLIPHNKNVHIANKAGDICKKCPKCQEIKILGDFGKYKKTWDGLNYTCRKCHNAVTKAAYARIPKLSKEEVDQSYKNRTEAKVKGAAWLKDNLEWKQQQSDRNSKPVEKLSLVGEVIKEYKNIKSYKADGYCYSGVNTAIKKNTKYKGFYWRLKLK